jgi:hypothetical protein
VSDYTWNKFDTFLRRAAMIGTVILVWMTIIFGVLAGSAIVSLVSNHSDTSTTDVTPYDPAYDPAYDPSTELPDAAGICG